tara:strand:- start:518 stop:991 length:474 start_codon:yes stop_codon:yes gene_type:complete
MSKQKRKGDGYERELARWLDKRLFGGNNKVTRAPLSGGGSYITGGGRADLIGTPDLWVEAKRTEKFQPYQAMQQAETGIHKSDTPEMPVVVQRRNGMKTGESLVVMRLNDFAFIYEAYLSKMGWPSYLPLVEEPKEDDRKDNIVKLFSVMRGEKDND